MIIRQPIFFFLFFLKLSTVFLWSQELAFTHFTSEKEINPLPSTSIDNIYQDSEGHIWFAIYSSGMVRYDGISMDVFNMKDGLRDVNVMNAQEDAAGRLWVLADGGVYVTEKILGDYNPGERIRFTDTLAAVTLVKASIHQTAPNAMAVFDSTVWVGTSGFGLFRYQLKGNNQVIADTFSIMGTSGNQLNIYAVGCRKNGDVWIGSEIGVFIFSAKNSRFRPLGEQKMVTHTFYETGNGALYGGNNDGSLWRQLPKSKTIEHLPNWLHHAIYDISQDHKGDLWIASHGSGVLKLAGAGHNEAVFINKDHGLINNSVSAIIEDKERSTWIAQSGGVSRLRPNYQAFANYTGKIQINNRVLLPSPSAYAILPPAAGDYPLSIATPGGITVMKSFSEVDWIDINDGLASNTIYDIYRDRKERLWIGNFEGLNCLYKPENQPTAALSASASTTRLFDETYRMRFYDTGIIGVCSNFDVPLSPDKATPFIETLWFNSYNRIICYADEEWFIFDRESGLPVSIMYSVSMDNQYHLWVSTGLAGVYRSRRPFNMEMLKTLSRSGQFEIDETVFEPVWNTDTGAFSNEVLEVICVGDTIWLGTAVGISVLSGKSLERIAYFNQENGLVDMRVASMAYMASTQSIWAGTNIGFAEVDAESLFIRRTVTRQNGLLGNETIWLESITTDHKNRVYFGSDNGMTRYNPALDNTPSSNFSLVFRAIDYHETAGGNVFSVDYAGLSYIDEKALRYRTRMLGYDEDWSDWTTEHKIRYTNLPAYFWAKDYTFDVQAMNGHSSTEIMTKSYSFSVMPRPWFRWWAFLLYGILMILLTIGGRWLAANWRVVFAPRKRYISHYKLDELLGEGGMGQVFKATDINTRETVAIKLLNEALLQDSANRERFRNEGRLLATFDHPNIVQVKEIGETGHQGFIAMEYLDGGTLRDLLKVEHPLPLSKISSILKQILNGLAEIHRHNIIHRDMKTDNIMLDKDGHLRIMDFGLSKSNLVTRMTTMGTVIGTLGYVAPEQITGTQVDHRVDIFSFGVIVYELISKKLPFTGENEMALIHAIFNTTSAPLSNFRSDIPEAWQQFTTRCLEKQPEARFQSIREITTALNQIQI